MARYFDIRAEQQCIQTFIYDLTGTAFYRMRTGLLGLLFLLTACGGGSDNSTNSNPVNNTSISGLISVHVTDSAGAAVSASLDVLQNMTTVQNEVTNSLGDVELTLPAVTEYVL